MGTPLQYTALGVLLGHADLGVREEGGENKGPAIRKYLASCDPPIGVAAPWCAAVIQYATDVAAKSLGVDNPLNEVELEAYVQSYVNWASSKDRIVKHIQVLPGDLVCFSFGGTRYDHIGMIQTRPNTLGTFTTVEGNTSDYSQREGDALVKDKTRNINTGHKPVLFIRWAH